MKWALAISALVSVVGVGGVIPSAHAQQWENRETNRPGSRMRVRAPSDVSRLPNVSPSERARLALNELALCRLEKDDAAFKKLMMEQPVPELAEEAYTKLALGNLADDCFIEGELRLTAPLYVGSVYVALLRTEYRRADRLPALTPIDYSSLADKNTAIGAQFIATRDFAQCVVMAGPAQSAALIFSRELSKSENEAFAAVAPQLGPCLPAGQKFTMSRSSLFGLLAEALYRSSIAQPVPAS